MFATYRRLLSTFVVLAIASSAAAAGEVLVAWSPSSGASGYNVHAGTSSGVYPQTEDVGNTTQATQDGLTDCTTWYFAVSAYNSAGESVASEGVATWPRAVVSSANPAVVDPGTQTTVVVSGTNFRDGDAVSLSNPAIQIDSLSVDGCGQLSLGITVGLNASPGPVQLSVTHPSGVSGNGTVLAISADVTPPIVSAVASSDVTGTTAVVTWTTDEPTDGQVFYRPQGTQTYLESSIAADLVTSHAIQLASLQPETTYEYHVVSADESGNTAVSAPDLTFTTLESPYSYLRFEAEGGALVDPIDAVEGPDAFGGAWIEATAGSGQADATDPHGTATFGVNLPDAGTWYLWVRMYGPGPDADSWFESVDGAARERIVAPSTGAWVWVEGRSYVLDGGVHLVELGGREADTRADRILLTDDPGFVPNEQPGGDSLPPQPVAGFTAVQGDGLIELTWTNPTDADYQTTVIRYTTDGRHPTSPLDGISLVERGGAPGGGDAETHDGVTVGLTYSYSAFAVDASGNVSASAQASAVVETIPAAPGNVAVH